MTGVFYTKKQKTLLRKRRQKKLKALQVATTTATTSGAAGVSMNGGDENDASTALTTQPPDAKKRKLNPTTSATEIELNHDNNTNSDTTSTLTKENPHGGRTVVEIPANLDAKAARKFRKEARRTARTQHGVQHIIQFLKEGQEFKTTMGDDDDDDDNDNQTKKTKKIFPSINALLQEQIKQQKEQQQQQQETSVREVKDELSESNKARYVALDCEMVGIGSSGKQSALARVSMVDWYGTVLMDTFVQVPSRVTDFRTHVSGVRAKDIQKNRSAMDVKECRDRVALLLKDRVLVGHALHNDLRALLLQHPIENIRDTAKYRPFQRVIGGSNNNSNNSKWRPRKLKDLVKQHLGKDIQVDGGPHDSVEDASSTMELFKLVRADWEKDLEAKQKKGKKKR